MLSTQPQYNTKNNCLPVLFQWKICAIFWPKNQNKVLQVTKKLKVAENSSLFNFLSIWLKNSLFCDRSQTVRYSRPKCSINFLWNMKYLWNYFEWQRFQIDKKRFQKLRPSRYFGGKILLGSLDTKKNSYYLLSPSCSLWLELYCFPVSSGTGCQKKFKLTFISGPPKEARFSRLHRIEAQRSFLSATKKQ